MGPEANEDKEEKLFSFNVIDFGRIFRDSLHTTCKFILLHEETSEITIISPKKNVCLNQWA